ncbi:MAG TPA: YggT family protein [Gammaproteobacteria bacterium]|nr:YggT family protein [Gammaproteobacteria bacterium]
MSGNGVRALIFVVNVAFSLYIAALYLRILLQRLGADYYNPLVQLVVRASDPLVRPLRRLLPSPGGWDFASFVLAVACAFLNAWLVLLLLGFASAGDLLLRYAGMKLLAVLVNLYIVTILIQALMSWLQPRRYSPLALVLWRLNEPLLAPVRRILPRLGMFDLSALVVLVVLEALSIFLGLPGYLS